MDRAVRATAAAWLAEGRCAVVVEVGETRGSVPRGSGTRMLVAAGEIAGTIGGGHLELAAITAARVQLARCSDGRSAARETQRYALGPRLGQCCGGSVDLAYAPLDALALAHWPAPVPLFFLQLHGAGHVGRAVATLLATLDCRVDWFDEREQGFPATTSLGSPWPGHIRRASAEGVEAEVGLAPAGAFFLVLTHEHALDLRIVEAVLRRGEFGWCGLIGSQTKRASFAHRLEAKGFRPRDVERIACPIGVPGIAGREPEVIAAAVVAQLLQLASEAAEPAVDEEVDAGHVRGFV